MPEMDGLEATREIRKLELDTKSATPIIALTAGIMQAERDKCLAAGMNEFLAKPIEQEKLLKVLNGFLLLKNL